MEMLMHALKKLSTAEEFLDFFAIEYQPATVHVNRLHILQRFHQYLRQTPLAADCSEDVALETCRALLDRAYRDFVGSSAIKEKVFKVFRDAEGVKTVSVENLRAALPQRQKTA
ncbi:MAG TPA: nitrogenase-stabilizing/protective protein NifW [Sulfuricella sp.]|nr:nitrogenase-stabilizing/protective protein NifW [Sulfuricella sp.]